jgi:hypothetical protein
MDLDMYEQLDKPKENKSRGVANSITQKRANGESTFRFADNRPDKVALIKHQDMVNNHSAQPQPMSLKALQMANSNHLAPKSNPQTLSVQRRKRAGSLFPAQKGLDVPSLNIEPVQCRAAVDNFTVTWSEDERGETGAGVRLDFSAQFRNDANHNPADAEFRQYAGDEWRRTPAGQQPAPFQSSHYEFDNYSRANDPGDYDDAQGTFTSHDLPGWQEGALAWDDWIDWKFGAHQVIVDPSRNNEVIATADQKIVRLRGMYPRDLVEGEMGNANINIE